MILGPFLAFPLHPASWQRPAGSPDYRVTNGFTGPDFLNGGQHRAVDVGNFRMGDPVRAPAACRARARQHRDGALGVEFDLGGGVTLELWHLNRLDISLNWSNVRLWQLVGVTGNSGPRLPTGQPMPAHTHIALKRNGVPFDPEPHLPMANRPAAAIPMEDDMRLPAAGYFATGIVGAHNRLRVDHRTTEGSEILTAPLPVALVGVITGGTSYTLDGRPGNRWYIVRRSDTGDVRQVATPLVTSIEPTPHLFAQVPLPEVDCSAEQNRIDRASTALTGASQALGVAQEALT
jgi:hypothetical protein